MSIIGRLFGSDEAIKTGIETVRDGLDALVYTKEEEATDNAKARLEAQKLLVQWLESSQGHRLARRIISLSITCVWLFMFLFGGILSFISIWVENPLQFEKSSKLIIDYADSMNGAVMLILGFYFAAPHISDIIKPAMRKFAKRPDENH